MSEPDENTLDRNRRELIRSEAAKAADRPLIEMVDGMLGRLHNELVENNWSRRIRQAWQDGQ